MKVSEYRAALLAALGDLPLDLRDPTRELLRHLAKLDDSELEELSRLVLKAKPKKPSDNQIGKPSAPKRRKKAGADVSVISNYMSRLHEAYRDDGDFERVAVEIANDSGISKDDVAKLFNDFFKASKEFPPKRTKAQRVEDMRRERIARIRFDAA